MNKKEFLGRLSELIKDIPEEEKKDILFDYEEHFRIGLEKGRKEEEIAASLGDPKIIAKQSRASCILREAEKTTSVNNIMRAIFAAVGLGFFNLVIVLGPCNRIDRHTCSIVCGSICHYYFGGSCIIRNFNGTCLCLEYIYSICSGSKHSVGYWSYCSGSFNYNRSILFD